MNRNDALNSSRGIDLKEIILKTRSLVSEAAMVGFNYENGDWAERLFANQAALTAALKVTELFSGFSVKPLVWSEESSRSTAEMLGFQYFIKPSKMIDRFKLETPDGSDYFPTTEAAKDAANKDLERRVLAIMVPTATPENGGVLGTFGHHPDPLLNEFAWESTTVGYIKYVTDERYQKFSAEVKRWYKPYNCSFCSANSLSAAPLETMAAQEVSVPKKRLLVKALEWRQGYRDDQVNISQAYTLGGCFQVRNLKEEGIFLDTPDATSVHPTIEHAMATAQADHERRISSIVVDLVPLSHVDDLSDKELNKALKDARTEYNASLDGKHFGATERIVRAYFSALGNGATDE